MCMSLMQGARDGRSHILLMHWMNLAAWWRGRTQRFPATTRGRMQGSRIGGHDGHLGERWRERGDDNGPWPAMQCRKSGIPVRFGKLSGSEDFSDFGSVR
jgi:hypothetical protein